MRRRDHGLQNAVSLDAVAAVTSFRTSLIPVESILKVFQADLSLAQELNNMGLNAAILSNPTESDRLFEV